MLPELETRIRQTFPNLLGPDAEFRFGNGWFVLFWMFLQKVEQNGWPVLLGPCHEKWGWLHIRFSSEQEKPLDLPDELYTLIFLLEYKSYYVCEECAQPGVIRWDFEHIKVLCDACEKTYNSSRKPTTPPYNTWPEEWRVERAAAANITL